MRRGLDFFFCEKFFMRANKPPCSQRNFGNFLDSIKLNQFVCKSKLGGGEGGKTVLSLFSDIIKENFPCTIIPVGGLAENDSL